MTKQSGVLVLAQHARVKPVKNLSRFERFNIAIKALGTDGFLRGLPRIEHMTDQELERLPTAETVLAPMVEALNRAGVPTEATVGGILRSLEMKREQLHASACCCHGDLVSAETFANRFRDVRDRRLY